MALPLLLAAGAGILGGTQYLMKRHDRRQAESMFNNLQSQVLNSPLAGTQQGDQLLATAQSAIENDSFWNRGMVSSQIQRYQDGMVGLTGQMETSQRARELQQEMENVRLSFQRGDVLNNQYERDLGGFSEVQSAYERALASTGDGANTADKIAALYNFFSIIDPGRAVQGNEAALFNSIGGLSSMGQNWWRSIFGKGMDETTREDIMQAIDRQYAPQYQKAMSQIDWFNDQYSQLFDAGYRFVSPVGSQGIRQGLAPGQFANAAPPAPTGGQVDPQTNTIQTTNMGTLSTTPPQEAGGFAPRWENFNPFGLFDEDRPYTPRGQR